MLRLPDHPGPPTLAELRAALTIAGDEDARWEAKGKDVDTDDIRKAIAGFANGNGGILVLGVEEEPAGWSVSGMDQIAGKEPGRWIIDLITGAMAPVPRIDPQIIQVDASGRWAAVVIVDPLLRDLTVLSSGRVVRRDHGRTSPVQDGSTLTEMVLRRAGVGLPARLDAALPADDLAEEVVRAARSGDLALLPSLLARLRTTVVRAIQFEPDPQPAMDQLTATAAALATASVDPAPLIAAVREHHVVFDEVQHLRGPANARHDLDLYRVLRPNVLALGGLLVRLRRWAAARALAVHRGPQLAGARRSWLVFIDHAQTEVSAARNAEIRRHPIRAGREATLRLLALRPDQADEHVALDSVLVFDLIANLVELDEADRAGYSGEVWPDFALFDASGVRPFAERLLTDHDSRVGLLPGRDDREVTQLLIALDARARHVCPEERIWTGLLTPEATAIAQRRGVLAP
jgi:hypothetical protein